MDIDELGVYTPADSAFSSDDFINEHGKLGMWVSEKRGEVLVFSPGGVMECQRDFGVNKAAYEFDRESNTVKITMGPFSYDSRLENGLLKVRNMGVFSQAGAGFDPQAFMKEHDASVLGIWYDPEGELTIDLHEDYTYDAVSYGKTFTGTYVPQASGATIKYLFLKSEIRESYTLQNGELLKDDTIISDAADRLVRTEMSQKNADQSADKLIGTWISNDDLIKLTFIDQRNVIVDIGDKYTYSYVFEPLGHIGLIDISGEKWLFVTNGDYLILESVGFSRVN